MLDPRPPLHDELLIGRWTLHAGRDELVLDGHRVKLEPRLTRVLLLLADNAGAVVGSATLHATVWAGLQVTPNSLHEAIARLRRVLAADALTPAYIATVPRRGYRLVAPVKRTDRARDAALRVAVLPFRATGLDGCWAPLRERVLEGLCAALSRRTPCTVLARGSALVIGAGADPVADAARHFHARCVVDGSIRLHGSGLRIGAELVDPPSGDLLWCDSVDSPPLDGPELALPLVERLARALELRLMAVLAQDRGAALSDARRLGMQAWVELFCRAQSERTNEAAWSLAQRAVQDDGDEVLARVARAYAGFRAANYGWLGLPRDHTVAAARSDVQHALALDPGQHDAWFTQAMLALIDGELSGAEASLRQALRLMPDMAPAWGNLAYLRIVKGHPDEAEALCARRRHQPLRAAARHLALVPGACGAGPRRPRRRAGRSRKCTGGQPRAGRGLPLRHRGSADAGPARRGGALAAVDRRASTLRHRATAAQRLRHPLRRRCAPPRAAGEPPAGRRIARTLSRPGGATSGTAAPTG